MRKLKNKDEGITLIALVITIIVLLILAGISISMLSGENGLLTRTTEAKNRTIHANVYEQLQLEELTYLSDKTTSKTSSTLIEYLKSKSIIDNEIGEDTGKYQVNVTALLGSRQSLGNGDATVELKDVYMLEKQSTSTGSIVNTKVATTTPIKIATTSTTQITYKVMYYGNGTSEILTLGSLTDSNDSSNVTPVAKTDESSKLTEYFSKGFDVIWKNESYQNIAPITDATEKLKDITEEYSYSIVQYGDSLYKITFEFEPWSATATMIEIDLTKFGEQEIGTDTVLVTPNTPDNVIHYIYEEPSTYENMYYLKSNGEDVDLERPFTGSVYRVQGSNPNSYLYYNSSGENVAVIQVSGPNTYRYHYYLKENLTVDRDRPFTEGYYSEDTGSYYDTSGALVLVMGTPSDDMVN